jgi:hypothetical protein
MNSGLWIVKPTGPAAAQLDDNEENGD